MSLTRRFRDFANEAFGLTPAQIAGAMEQVYKRGDRTLRFFVLCHVAAAFFHAFSYGTWWITIPVTLAAASMFFISVALMPGSQGTRFVAGIALQVFVALHIYQLHGLPEMHFYFFTAQTMMIVYEDYVATWPGTVLIFFQHIGFAVLQNTGSALYFFPDSYITVRKLALHIGIALVQVIICSYWAILQRRHRLHSLHQALEVERSRQKSEEAAIAKARFLANMSHEIRTPMNGVLGLTDVLLHTQLSEEQREYGQTIQSSGHALLAILDDVLDISKIDAGGMTLEPVECPLRPLVDEVASMLAPKAAAKQLELAVRVDPEAPVTVTCDPTRLRQILLNLGGNAIKFTSTGHVLLDVALIKSRGAACRLRFTVEDTGIGIPKNALATVFERFHQADASTTRRFGGTGLGLSISQKLVELMGGRICVSSSLGHGSRFEFTLELPAREAVPAHPLLNGFRVLLLEPHPLSRSIVSELLASWGIHVTVIETLAESHAAAASREAGVLLTTFDALRNAPPPPLPLVVMHRLDQPTKLDQEPGAFPLHWLLTPVRSERLAEVLTRLRQPEPALPTTQASDNPVSGVSEASLRILVAEDNPVNQRVATAMLQRLGCAVDIASNGAKAVEMWRNRPYDAIFMDCQMPELDGFEAAAAIRSQEPGGCHIPIIALTANAMAGDAERCLEGGMDGYLSKPVSLDKLREALEQHTRASPTTAI